MRLANSDLGFGRRWNPFVVDSYKLRLRFRERPRLVERYGNAPPNGQVLECERELVIALR